MGSPSESPEPRGPMPRWKVASFVLAAALLTTGLGIQGFLWLTREAETAQADATRERRAEVRGGAVGSVRAEGSEAGLPEPIPAVEEPEAKKPGLAERSSPFMIESGLSFFLAFCVGAAFRALLRTIVVVIGLCVVGGLGLQYAGLIPPIEWSAASGVLERGFDALQRGVTQLESVLAHGLPSGTMAGLGLASGLKR